MFLILFWYSLRLIESEFVPSEEFPEGGPAAIRDLDTHPFLRIQEEEAETWQQTVRPDDIDGLTAVDKKRQEHIYEVILTESNHCQVLKVIQKVHDTWYFHLYLLYAIDVFRYAVISQFKMNL